MISNSRFGLLAAVLMAAGGLPTGAAADDHYDSVFSAGNASPAAVVDAAAQNRMQKAVERQLKRTKVIPGGRKAPEDFFLVGKVELNMADRAANVQFDVIGGREQAAEQISHYMVTSPSQTARQWQLVGRFKDSDTAQQALQHTRQQYDQLVSYREQMMKRYQARSMCRT